jgi:hypothetical protein
MSHPELVEHAERMVVQSRMRFGERIVLAALGFLPLLAPYELLFKLDWEHFMNPFFFFAAFISAGATALSGFFFFAAAAGLSSKIIFDRHNATFSYFEKAPVSKRSRQAKPLSALRNVEVGVREWSDGAPAYHLNVVIKDGVIFESGSSWSRDEIEQIQGRVEQFLAAYEE